MKTHTQPALALKTPTARLRESLSTTRPAGPIVRATRDWERPVSSVIQAALADSAAQRGSASKRTKALLSYANEVEAANRQFTHLKAIEAQEYALDATRSRVADLLSATASDQPQVEHLTELSREARAATESLRTVVREMSGTISTMPSRHPQGGDDEA